MIHTATEDLQIQLPATRDGALIVNTQPAVTPPATLAVQAFQFLLTLTALPAAEQNRLAQQTAIAEDWRPWALGGFWFADGSVLRRYGLEWQNFSPLEALEYLGEHSKQPLEVRLCYAFQASDGRQKCTVTEARFSYQVATNQWRLLIEYEAYMDSPLYGFSAERFADLADLQLWQLRVDARPCDRWQLEQIALHPDWLELLLISSRPDRTPGAPNALEHPQLAKPLVKQSRATRNDGFEITVTPANLKF